MDNDEVQVTLQQECVITQPLGQSEGCLPMPAVAYHLPIPQALSGNKDVYLWSTQDAFASLPETMELTAGDLDLEQQQQASSGFSSSTASKYHQI